MLRSCKRQGYLLLKQVASQSGASSGRTAASCKSQLACRTVPETKLFSARTFGSHSRFGQHDPEIPTEVLVASLLFPLTQGTSLYWAGKRAFSTNNNTSGPDHPDREPPGQTAAASPRQEDFEVDEQPDSQPDSQQTLPAVPEDEAKYDLDAQDGPRQMSLQEYDAVLDRWGELLQEGKLDEILDLMEYAYGGYEPLPPLEEMLAGNQADEEKAERRAREKALQEDFARQRVQVIDDLGRSYATGKRKTSVARVWLKPGSGIISVNGKGFDHVFPTIERRQDVLAPLAITGTYGTYDVKATVRGGGVTGQAQALRHGIGKALQLYDPTLRPPLKTAGFLVRDARVVERKKPGRAKARKSFQWVKR